MTNALTLLRAGYDTAEIAEILKTTEAKVYNDASRLREEERKAKFRAFTYHRKEESRGKIPYAGREY
ncbi:hypothetical protein [Agrobacterium radiobacter]|uniref:hypothetical protein n=1 Tax=Agrobacterium radiobacter TaxID=362 RepID=UPI003F879563